MELKVFNRHNQILCTYVGEICFPTESELNSMARAEYYFKLNDKKISLKKLKEELRKLHMKGENDNE